MMECDCEEAHGPRRVVLTGGPGAGKTATLELIRRASFCEHVQILPEAAGIVFGGGFPRRMDIPGRRAAYWPGLDDFFRAVKTTLADEIRRYDAVIHLRTPPLENGYNHQNPLRTETAIEAAEVDVRILRIWETHPRRFVVDATPDFLTKAARVLELMRAELPECCRHHVVREIDRSGSALAAVA